MFSISDDSLPLAVFSTKENVGDVNESKLVWSSSKYMTRHYVNSVEDPADGASLNAYSAGKVL